MLWTYRIVRDPAGRYSIREVFYENDGQLLHYSQQPVAPLGSSLEDLLHLIHHFQEAFNSPILALEDLEAQLPDPPPAKPLGDRSHTLSLQEVLAQLNPAPTSVE